ncbi:hypothetical protein V8F20_008271 [Naviculisporaceae sp. PSN 640]
MAQPRLRKKASIRDRLKAWPKPTQSTLATSTSPYDQPKRFVYQPKHAASDFSRMVISSPAPATASRRNAKPSFDEDSTLSPSLEPVDARHTIPRDDSISNDAQDFALQRSRSGARRQYKMTEDPWMASQTAAHVPIGRKRQPIPQQADKMAASLADEQESSAAASQNLSDFEAFLARAEAEDRAQREQILRSFSHHSSFQSPNYVRPNPHRQFAKVTGGDLSGTTVIPGPVSAGGSRSSRGESHRTSGQYALSGSEEQYQPRSLHTRHASWTPSFGADSAEIERSLEKGGSSTWGPPQRSTPRTRKAQPAQPQKALYSVNESAKQPEQPRTLRRQTSIAQRIAEYIKPSAAGSSEQTLYDSASRTGLRKSGSQRRPRGIETLHE